MRLTRNLFPLFLFKDEEGAGGGSGKPDSSTGDQDDKPWEALMEKDPALAAAFKGYAEQRLRGQGKKLGEKDERIAALEKKEADRKAADEEARKKKMEKDGELKTLLEQERAEKKTAQEKLTALQEKETKRLKALVDTNEKRAKKLPKWKQELIPAGLDPDAARTQIDLLEKMEQGKPPRDVDGQGGKNQSPDDPAAFAAQAGDDLEKNWRRGFKEEQS
jgi:hypothetical protein